MGVFSGREVTSVATSVVRAIPDASLPNSPKTAVIKSIIKNGQLSEYLQDAMTNSIGIRAERMYEYAAKEYTFGLPSGEFFATNIGDAEVKAILDAESGQDTQIDYTHLGPFNTLHMGWDRLTRDYGYNSITNEIESYSGAFGQPVYLANMTVMIPAAKFDLMNPKALEQWGVSPRAGFIPTNSPILSEVKGLVGHSPVVRSATATHEEVLVEYLYAPDTALWDPYTETYSTDVVLTPGSFTIPITGFNPEAEYFHAMYEIGGRNHFWTYELNLGSYPQLDALFNSPPSLEGEFFPFAYFRLGKTSMAIDTQAAQYKTTKKMLNYLGMNYQALIDSIHSNSDIANVEQALLMFAVPANTEHPLEQAYLFDFFDRLRLSQAHTSPTYDLATILASFAQRGADLSSSAIVIQDSAFKMSLSNGGIFKRRRGGSIGPRGSYKSVFIEKTGYFTAHDSETGDYQQSYSLPCHYYQKQISDSMYDEIEIINLRTTYYIYGNYTSIGDGQKDILMVPIDRTLTALYNIPIKEQLYSRSLYYVFNSVTMTQLAWYSSDIFMGGLFVAAIILAWFTMGESLIAFTALATAGFISFAAILWSVATMLVEGLLLTIALRQIVKIVGPEVAIAIALFAAAYGLAGSSSLMELPFAETLLSVSSGLLSATNNAYTGKIQEIQTEYADLQIESLKVSDLINNAQELLNTSSLLSPLTIIGEGPDDYYRRTMYSGNVGVASINGVTNYVERALTLPTIAMTLGQEDNQA